MAEQIQTLADAYLKELRRNRELLVEYRLLPDNAGWFGAAMISALLDQAERALAEQDVVQMLALYDQLKATE